MRAPNYKHFCCLWKATELKKKKGLYCQSPWTDPNIKKEKEKNIFPLCLYFIRQNKTEKYEVQNKPKTHKRIKCNVAKNSRNDDPGLNNN